MLDMYHLDTYLSSSLLKQYKFTARQRPLNSHTESGSGLPHQAYVALTITRSTFILFKKFRINGTYHMNHFMMTNNMPTLNLSSAFTPLDDHSYKTLKLKRLPKRIGITQCLQSVARSNRLRLRRCEIVGNMIDPS